MSKTEEVLGYAIWFHNFDVALNKVLPWESYIHEVFSEFPIKETDVDMEWLKAQDPDALGDSK